MTARGAEGCRRMETGGPGERDRPESKTGDQVQQEPSVLQLEPQPEPKSMAELTRKPKGVKSTWMG